MKLEDFYTYQEQTFDSFMGKVIKNEGKDAKKEIARRADHEISISQLMERELAQIAAADTYDFGKMTFYVRNNAITVHDMLLGQAIAALPPYRREVILLAYFMNKNDPQIGELLNVTPNTIRYRRKTSLEKLKRILEMMDYEK